MLRAAGTTPGFGGMGGNDSDGCSSHHITTGGQGGNGDCDGGDDDGDGDCSSHRIATGGQGGNDCGGGGGGATPTPQVLGSSAQITKTRTSGDPAIIGETVTFNVSLTITGDTTVTDVTLTDTFENAYLGAVGTLPAGCTVTTASPDLAHNTIRCLIGTVTPGTAGAPGSKTFDYTFSMLALASTGSGRTLNEARATLDPDGAGPAGPATIGPAPATVQIVDASRVLLPPTGDGSMAGKAAAGGASAVALGLVILLAAARATRGDQRGTLARDKYGE